MKAEDRRHLESRLELWATIFFLWLLILIMLYC
jgi:hypothetical protein